VRVQARQLFLFSELLLFTKPAKVRKTPGWPRSWANSSLLQLCSHRSAWTNLHLLGQPDTFLAPAQGRRWQAHVRGPTADLHWRLVCTLLAAHRSNFVRASKLASQKLTPSPTYEVRRLVPREALAGLTLE
jgi:hypothetical protein